MPDTRYDMGIDGGGSTLRVVIVDHDLKTCAYEERGTANPNVIGRDAATALIREAVASCLAACPVAIRAVGIGVAGAAAFYAADWLTATLREVLPDSAIVPSSDNEIALTGAMGKRDGMLLLAGTGSVGYGVNPAGESLQVGGWGYRLGDEGSGYWMGIQAIKRVIRAYDHGEPFPVLWEAIQRHYAIQQPKELVEAVYLNPTPVPKAAGLAQAIFEAAQAGDPPSQHIVQQAAVHLAELAWAMEHRLGIPAQEVVFAGGLLTNNTPLRSQVCAHLNINAPLPTHYTPVVGAALLARLQNPDD